MDDKIKSIFGFEDDIVVNYIISFLEDYKKQSPDIRILHMNIREFLDKDTDSFMTELYTLLIESSKEENKIVIL